MTTLTLAQRAVITSTAHHLLVDAGAGSGKTTTVVQALCHQLGVTVLADGKPLPPVALPLTFEQVAAITFTNQAAADLKRKLRAALRVGGRRDLAAEVDSARIGTIHGFCGDLLRDFALRAGARPGRRVLEEGEGAAMARDCAHAALVAAIANDDVDGLDTLLAGRRLKDISTYVAQVADDSDRLARMEQDRGALRAHENALLIIATRAAALRRDQLDREGVLDFDRMIVATRDLLKDDVIRRAVQHRVRLLVLDEFQDVDPVQRDIAFLLGGIEIGDPSPTRIVLVGDPKQSIYRFRRADVTLWNAVAARFRNGAGTVLPLHENFRSKAAILGLVDSTVGKALNTPVSGATRHDFEVDYSSLTPKAGGADGDHAVEFLVVPAAEDGKAQKADTVRALEATAVARRITELHADGTPFGDMAILLASWSAVTMYAGAMQRAGIPLYVLRSEGFWRAREVLDCVLALRAIRDCTDDVALVGFLKSPFVGVRDDTLLALARAADGRGLATVLATVTNERPLLDRASQLLAALGALRDRVSVHVLLQRLLSQSGYRTVLALDLTDGPQAIANLRKLIRLAAAAPNQSLGEFLRNVAEQRDREDKVAPERLYRERSNVVTVTTIHSAKGLEWPVVFWADLVREITADHDKLLMSRHGFRVKDESAAAAADDGKDPEHQALATELVLEQRAEAYRLWYVASTRAKERLVLSGIPMGDMRTQLSPARVLRDTFPSLGQDAQLTYESATGETFHATVRVCDGVAAPDAEPATVVPVLALPPATVSAVSGGSRLSASQLLAFAHNETLWWERYVLRCEPVAGGGVSRFGASVIATGLIVHDVLERYGQDSDDLVALIEDAIAMRDEDAPSADSSAGAAYRALVRTRVEAATTSSVWQGLANAGSARRELSFTRILADGTAINGALDLAARDGATARLLDVKTTSGSAAQMAERYSVQAAVYADAVQAISGVTAVTFTLLTVPAGESAVVTTGTDMAALVAKLRAYRPTP